MDGMVVLVDVVFCVEVVDFGFFELGDDFVWIICVGSCYGFDVV